MGSKIAVRTYSEKEGRLKKDFKSKTPLTHKRVLVFDTETSVDEFQNLTFGSFLIVDNGKKILRGIFYSPENISKKEEGILINFCDANEIELYTREDFVKDIFYPEVLMAKTLCIGFNLPFDLSRLAIHFGEGRYNHRQWFSMELTEDKRYPRVKIKHIDSTKSFIELGHNKFSNNKNKFKGHFLDLRTLACVFTDNKSINLRRAGESFECEILKTKAEEHGIINEDYIRYNLNDVEATFNLYQNLEERYLFYDIPIPITYVYSSASLGKHALKNMGVMPLSRINSDIDARLKGELMMAYFGGRCEARVRKEPVVATTLDFLSMYPSLTINMGLWDFIIAKEIKTKEVTEEIKSFLEKIRLEDLRDKEIWKGFNVLVELEADEDILPLRSNYLEKSPIYNVGINYVKNKQSLFYALPDVISSVLLTGKVPKIKRAIRFIPIGKQESLKKTEVLGIKINPAKDNFIKKLIEKRYEVKQKRDSFKKGTPEYNRLDEQQRALKILANSSTYGIFIEMRQQDKKSEFKVHSKDSFWVKQKMEEEGKFFNPLIAVMQIAGARLLLSMAESYISQKGETHYYMDTDSCFVPPHLAEPLRDFFAPLNPYDFNADFFEIEKEKLLFYAISSKRYVLYKMNKGRPEIVDYKLHGLGHLLNPYKKGINWQKQIWQDVLDLHYENISEQEIINKYSQFYCLSRLSVSTPVLHQRFKKYNEYKPFSQQIKPFNFFLIGQGTEKDIKPIASFSTDPQEGVFKPFINYRNGEIMQGEKYWRPLSEIILKFVNHPESKFKNGNTSGAMKRRFVYDGTITLIGKETRNLETQCLGISKINEYTDEEELRKKILAMTPKEARGKGVLHRSTLKRWKDKVKNKEKLKLSSQFRQKLLS